MTDIIELTEALAKTGARINLEDLTYIVTQDQLTKFAQLLQQGEPVTQLALNNTELQKRISVLEDLLSSAYNIANRNGENTHWQRFASQLHINGISPITAKVFKVLPSDTDYTTPKELT